MNRTRLDLALFKVALNLAFLALAGDEGWVELSQMLAAQEGKA